MQIVHSRVCLPSSTLLSARQTTPGRVDPVRGVPARSSAAARGGGGRGRHNYMQFIIIEAGIVIAISRKLSTRSEDVLRDTGSRYIAMLPRNRVVIVSICPWVHPVDHIAFLISVHALRDSIFPSAWFSLHCFRRDPVMLC